VGRVAVDRDRNATGESAFLGPITRLTSRVWNLNAMRPFGSFENTLSASAVQSPDSAQSFTRRLSGASYV
jgi:hypothetical protein